jgi:hypothetical protein
MAIVGRLKQSTTATIVLGPFVDSVDGVTAETALTIGQANVRMSKNSGTFAQSAEATASTHMEFGYYSKPINATDTNTLGRLVVTVQVAGALPIRQDYEVVPASEFDRLFTLTGPIPELGIIARNTAQAATATTVQLATAEVFANSTPVGCTAMVFGSTQGYWQVRSITGYVGSTDTATVDAWDVTPTGTITYIIFAGAPSSATSLPIVDVREINNANVIGTGGPSDLWRGA